MNDADYEEFLLRCAEECPDLGNAILAARNCLLCEADAGPDSMQATSLSTSLSIPRSEAWQLSYAMGLLENCGSDAARLTATRTACTSLCVRSPYREGRWGRIELSRAIDLCDQTLRMIEGITAALGDVGLPLLRALCKHEKITVALGIIEPIAESAKVDLRQAVRLAGAAIADLPSPEQLVAWAFPWL